MAGGSLGLGGGGVGASPGVGGFGGPRQWGGGQTWNQTFQSGGPQGFGGGDFGSDFGSGGGGSAPPVSMGSGGGDFFGFGLGSAHGVMEPLQGPGGHTPAGQPAGQQPHHAAGNVPPGW